MAFFATYFYISQTQSVTNGGLDISERSFAVKDPAEIHKIVIKNKALPTYVIERDEKKEWKFNEFYKADRHIMTNIIEVLTKVDVKFIPPSAARQHIVDNMNKIGIAVEIYNKAGDKIRDYIVGSNLNDERGTYYLVRGKSQPYAMEFPYIEGSLRDRFVYQLQDLRDRYIFDENVERIVKVEVHYPKSVDKGYILVREGSETWDVLNANGEKSNTKVVNQRAVEDVLSEFEHVASEAFENENPKRDRIESAAPFCTIDVTFDNGVKKAVKLLPVLDFVDDRVQTDELEQLELIERFFVQTNWKDLYSMQKLQVKKVLRPYNYFFK